MAKEVERPEDETLALALQAKAVLRKRARALRNTIPKEALSARSERIVATLAALPEVAQAKSVALYHPIIAKSEVDLRALDAALRATGKVLAYPSIDPATRTMTFRRVDDPSALEERGLGFAEPPPDAPELDALDVVVVPALLVDPRGHRIGYGAGFYDRTLPRFSPPAVTIGVAFDFQLAPEIPATPGDVPLDVIVTDARTLQAFIARIQQTDT